MENLNLRGVIGSTLGILAGAVATYFSIRNTKGPRERRFVIRAATVCWMLLALVAVAAYLLPHLRTWVWVPLCAMAIFGGPYVNRRQENIRQDERSGPAAK